MRCRSTQLGRAHRERAVLWPQGHRPTPRLDRLLLGDIGRQFDLLQLTPSQGKPDFHVVRFRLCQRLQLLNRLRKFALTRQQIDQAVPQLRASRRTIDGLSVQNNGLIQLFVRGQSLGQLQQHRKIVRALSLLLLPILDRACGTLCFDQGLIDETSQFGCPPALRLNLCQQRREGLQRRRLIPRLQVQSSQLPLCLESNVRVPRRLLNRRP